MIGIINYGFGNIFSINKSLTSLGAEVLIIEKPEDLVKVDKFILPGVGHASEAMAKLKDLGFMEPLSKAVLEEKKPILGICLGFQLMATESEEGDVRCLGWFEAEVKKFVFDGSLDLHIPHMGWNTVSFVGEHPLFADLSQNDEFYFAHSYHVFGDSNLYQGVGMTDYGRSFISVIAKDNIMGVQFHPEKSHSSGLKLLQNFINI